jgi:hypothetical protein
MKWMRGRNVSILVQGTEQTQILANHRHRLWRTNDVFMYRRVVSGFFYVQLHSMSKLKHHVYPEVEDLEHLHLANVCLSDPTMRPTVFIQSSSTISTLHVHTMIWKMVIMDTVKNSTILILNPTWKKWVYSQEHMILQITLRYNLDRHLPQAQSTECFVSDPLYRKPEMDKNISVVELLRSSL